MKIISCLCCWLLIVPFAAYAEVEHEHHHTEAHVHGVAHLNWVMAGSKLQLSLVSPMADLLGFEHQPRHAEEQQQMTAMLAKLNEVENVLSFVGDSCEVESLTIHNPFQPTAHHDAKQMALAPTSNHNEVTAEYQFFCPHPSQLQSIKINLFDTFSGFNVIHSQWIVEGKQGGGTLDRHHHLLKVR